MRARHLKCGRGAHNLVSCQNYEPVRIIAKSLLFGQNRIATPINARTNMVETQTIIGQNRANGELGHYFFSSAKRRPSTAFFSMYSRMFGGTSVST